MNKFSRRDLLKYAGSATALLAGPHRLWPLSRSRIGYVDVARQSGITFSHDNAASPEKFLTETMGSGCGWIDYDQDGLLDLDTPVAELVSDFGNNGDQRRQSATVEMLLLHTAGLPPHVRLWERFGIEVPESGQAVH